MLIGLVNAIPVKAEDYRSINFVFIYKELFTSRGVLELIEWKRNDLCYLFGIYLCGAPLN